MDEIIREAFENTDIQKAIGDKILSAIKVLDEADITEMLRKEIATIINKSLTDNLVEIWSDTLEETLNDMMRRAFCGTKINFVFKD